MSNAAKASFNDLVDVWWKTAEVLEAVPPADEGKVNWHAHIFGKILVQCGWTVVEWNDHIAVEKAK